MFKLGQILTATHFVRNDYRIMQGLELSPQHVLATQRNRSHTVVVNAGSFENLSF